MRRFLNAVLGSVALVCGSNHAVGEAVPYIFSTPDISAQWVSFSYDDNIWLVPRQGGLARQLTNATGPIRNGRFSPDGKTLAYTKTLRGNADVYTIAVDGGVSQRLSYHPEPDAVVAWHPVDNRVLFKSMRESFRPRFNQFYTVSAAGGNIEKLPLTYAETGSYCDDGVHLAYTYTNDFQDGNETWKRYKGGRAPDIWIYNSVQNSVRQLTEYTGIDTAPMCIGEDLYFLSDRGSDKRSNIWVLRGWNSATQQVLQPQQITHFTEHDIRHPAAGAGAIVFENGGFLYTYDAAAADLKKLDVSIAAQRRNMAEKSLPLDAAASVVKLSGDGSQLVIAARGEVLSYDIRRKLLRNLTQSPAVAERFPSLSADNVLAYMGDAQGEYQLFTHNASGKLKQQSNYAAGFRFQPFWSPDGQRVAFVDEKQDIHIVDVRNGRDSVIARSRWKTFFALRAMTFSWSPDGQWLLFNMADQGRNQALYLYSLKAQSLKKITAGYYNDRQAVFCGNGAFICVLSQREYNPVYGDQDPTWVYSGSSGLYLMPLQADTGSPFANADKPAQATDEPGYKWRGIDSTELEQRLVSLPVKAGDIASIYAAGMHLVYPRKMADGKSQIFALNIMSGKERSLFKDADLLDVSASAVVLAETAADKKYHVFSLAAPEKREELDLAALTLRVNPELEKHQVVTDAWRLYRDFYYDPALHGRDWPKELQRYQALIDVAHSDEDVNRIVRELGGELEGGHVWATSTAARVRWRNETVGLLGIDLAVDGDFYRIEKVYAPAPWLHDARSPLAAPGLPDVSGMYLLAINGVALHAARSPWHALEGQLEQWVEITVAEHPQSRKPQTLRVKTIASERRMRELDWVESNRRYVESKTAGRVGYIYVPDTSRAGQDALMRQYQAQYHKQALIVDARFNSGGALGDRFVELLNRPLLNYFSTRNADDSQLPEIANSGPKILLTNGWSYSGGDGFPFLFQQANVGPVLGERSWGGLIGPSLPIPLINGAAVSPAPQRVYDRDGNWGTGGDIGVTPDIIVKNLPGDLLQGVDAQLDSSIDWIMQALAEPRKALKPPIAR